MQRDLQLRCNCVRVRATSLQNLQRMGLALASSAGGSKVVQAAPTLLIRIERRRASIQQQLKDGSERETRRKVHWSENQLCRSSRRLPVAPRIYIDGASSENFFDGGDVLGLNGGEQGRCGCAVRGSTGTGTGVAHWKTSDGMTLRLKSRRPRGRGLLAFAGSIHTRGYCNDCRPNKSVGSNNLT